MTHIPRSVLCLFILVATVFLPLATVTHPSAATNVSIIHQDNTVPLSAPTTGEVLKSVAAGADDGFSGAWGFYRGLAWYEVGNPGSAYNGWFRFTGITIPKGATIVEAHLELAQASWPSGTRLRIRAEKAASPAAPTSTSNHTSKVRTTAGVDWTSGYSDWTYHNSPNFASVIQELVNAYDYSAGGAIQVLVDNNGSTGECTGPTFEAGKPPRLYIKWR